MKRRNIATMGVVAAMWVTVLAGCSSERNNPPLSISVPSNAKELAESVIANMENITSLTGDMVEKFSGEMKILEYTVGMDSVNTMKVKAYIDEKEDIEYAEGNRNYKITGLESPEEDSSDYNSTMTYEIYSVGSKTDGKYTVYSKSDIDDSILADIDDGWTVSDIDVSMSFIDVYRSIYKAIAEGEVEAKLLEDSGMVNNKDTYVLEANMSVKFVMDLIESMDASYTPDSDFMGLENAVIPVTFYVYKDTKFPAKIELDAKEIGEQIISEFADEDDMESDMEINIKECMIEAVFDNYNSVKKFTVPQNVINEADENDKEDV